MNTHAHTAIGIAQLDLSASCIEYKTCEILYINTYTGKKLLSQLYGNFLGSQKYNIFAGLNMEHTGHVTYTQ